MRKLIVALFLCNMAFISQSFAAGRDTAFLTKRFPVSSVTKIDVATAGGRIEVNGSATQEAIVELFIQPNNASKWTDEKIQSVLDEHYELDIKTENGVLTAHAHRKKGFKWSSNTGLSISFRITTPRTVDGEIKTSGGSIELRNVSGTLDFHTSGGSIRIDKATGHLTGKTSGGSVQISDSKDYIDIATSGGSIKAEDCSGTITLQTSGGSINLNDLSGNITAKTSGGSVRAEDITGTLHASTSGGNMILEDIAGNLEASTSGGRMKVDMRSVAEYVRLHNSGRIDLAVPSGGYTLDLKSREVNTPELNAFSGSLKPNDITGTQYGGGPELTVKSSHRVSLSFK
ncbi:MAG: hypothetical protein LBT61_04220 [Prevotellaceae bacterium]|jgi:hypothetical protein|nr:hypothetical protein [Prevotellaceae bacterium]